ncbi:hypothetical protein [Pseudomonas sp. GM48]|uniref:hypothetical protein n=1 Tax=Pseudomonas sp. GM48 TaxID=1144330 RepID=UPI00027052A7|nr:hypothetical protein [Pseudomonas sp. GM48]EJM54789.1 hypothetical protein PMI28_03716 [Pseudomonas sp. GM48]
MKVINGQSKTSWKTVVYVIFCTLFLTACAEANETNAGLCNGNWGLVGGYYCDISSPGDQYFVFFLVEIMIEMVDTEVVPAINVSLMRVASPGA